MSCSMPSTTAVRPASARSKTSAARARAQAHAAAARAPRRRRPRPRPAPGARARPTPPRHCRPHHAVQAHELLGLERLACGRGSPRARGSASRISAFSASVRPRMLRISSWSISPPSKRSPGLSGAIRGWSSRMIGDDSTVSSAVADEHGPHALVAARSAARPQRRRRIGQRDEAPRPCAAPRASSRTCAAAPPRGRRPSNGVVFAIVTATRQRPSPTGATSTSTLPVSAPSAGSARPPASPSSSSQRLASSRARRRSTDRAGRDDLALDRLLPREVARARDRQLVDAHEPAAASRADVAAHDVQEAHADVDVVAAVAARAGTRCASASGRPDARSLCARGMHAAERPAALVLQRRAPVGPQHVALVQDGVGDAAHGRVLGPGRQLRDDVVPRRPARGATCRRTRRS